MNNKVLIFIMIMVFLLYTYSMMGCTECTTRTNNIKKQSDNNSVSESFANQQPSFNNIYEIGHYMS